MTAQRILVVEDDDAIREGILDALAFDGYRTLEAATGGKGLELALHTHYDLLLLDLVLPGKDGLDILKAVRAGHPTLPVIILTARGDEDDRVRGLKLGADDYVVKPFSVRELLARVEAVLRRSPERPLDVSEVRFAGGVANLERCEVAFDEGGHAVLSAREAELLRYLAANVGRVVARDELLARVWGINPNRVETRTIDVHIGRLREKLRDDAVPGGLIRTIRGKGYIYDPEGGGTCPD